MKIIFKGITVYIDFICQCYPEMPRNSSDHYLNLNENDAHCVWP